jgi:hypothetical protein
MVTQQLNQTKKTGTIKDYHTTGNKRHAMTQCILLNSHYLLELSFHSIKTLEPIFINHLYKIQIEPSDMLNMF